VGFIHLVGFIRWQTIGRVYSRAGRPARGDVSGHATAVSPSLEPDTTLSLLFRRAAPAAAASAAAETIINC